MGITVLIPGGFKPPHAGHLDLVNKYAAYPEVDEVRVLVGPSERDGINRAQSLKVWEALPTHPKVKVIPVNTDNPMVAAYESVLNLPPNAKGTYALGSSSKGEDAIRSKQFVKSIEAYKTKATRDGKMTPKGVKAVELPVDTKPLLYKGRRDDLNNKGISASVLRRDLADPQGKINFYSNYPGIDKGTVDKIYDILTAKKKKIRESALFGQLLESLAEKKLLAISILKSVITEGGAAGHMAHPFDLPSVSTGKDLIKVFEDTAKFLQRNEVPVKIDGINSSIRLANIDVTKQFVLDRGSNKPFDVKGMTSADLESRFGAGHGMIKVGGNVLDIFNEALPSIKGPLSKLGMTKNPNLMLNIEYVEGQSNVQQYEGNFIVIHNLLEIKPVTPKRRATEEAPYSPQDLQNLVDKLKPIAKKKGFEVFNVIPAKVENPVDFGSALSETYTVNYSKGKKETKSLAQWLSSAKNTKGQKLKLKDGRTVDALSKQVFMWINSGKPVDQLVENPRDSKLAVDSFVIYLATIKLGDEILKSMTSPLGSLDQQEGIVVRNRKLNGGKPYKITGSFITRGLESSFN
jgi:hypothetical protein